MKRLLILLMVLPGMLMAQKTNLRGLPKTGIVPAVTANPTVFGNFTNQTTVASQAQVTHVNGTNLISTEDFSYPAQFEAKQGVGGTYISSPLHITPSGGSTSDDIYIRGKASNGVGNYQGSLSIGSTGANVITIPLNLTVSSSAPSITASTPLALGTIIANTVPGNWITCLVSASNLAVSSIAVGSGSGIEYSIDGGNTPVNTANIPVSGGSLTNYSLLVRIAQTGTVGVISGSFSLTAGAASATVTYSGSVSSSTAIDTLVSYFNLNASSQSSSSFGAIDASGNPGGSVDLSFTDFRNWQPVTIKATHTKWVQNASHSASNTGGPDNVTWIDAAAGKSYWFTFLGTTIWFGPATIADSMYVQSGLDPTQTYFDSVFVANNASNVSAANQYVRLYRFTWNGSAYVVDSFTVDAKGTTGNGVITTPKSPDPTGRIIWAIKTISGGTGVTANNYGIINAHKTYKKAELPWMLFLLLGMLRKRRKKIERGFMISFCGILFIFLCAFLKPDRSRPDFSFSTEEIWKAKELNNRLAFTFNPPSESNDMITVDTVMKLPGNSEPYWVLRIRRPRVDTASRPAIWFMPGAGETGLDTTGEKGKLAAYGPFDEMNRGWDGSITLGNGVHYPILITACVTTANVRPQYVAQMMDTILRRYHIKTVARGFTQSVHVMGMSMGGWTWGRLLSYSADGTETHGMSLMRSFVSLLGNAADNFNGVSFGTTAYRKWVNLYDGRYFSLEGTNDTRNLWLQRDSMVNAGSTKAYFSYENYGSPAGSHSGWQSYTSLSNTDWRCIPTITNTNLAVNKNHANSLGNYQGGTNVFTWMLQQGDTSLVGACSPIVSAGSNQTVNLPTSTASLSGSATAQCSGTISTYLWQKVSGPTGGTIANPAVASTTVSGLNVGTYVYSLQATDNSGNVGSNTMIITVVANSPPTVSAGQDTTVSLPTSSTIIHGSASANGSATLVSTQWSQGAGPNTLTLSGQTTLNLTVSNLALGQYILRLKATDNNGASTTDSMILSVVTIGPRLATNRSMGLGEYQSVFIKEDSTLWGLSQVPQNLGFTSGGLKGKIQKITLTGADTAARFVQAEGQLHGGLAVDKLGRILTFGDCANGQCGFGIIGGAQTPHWLTIDSLGNPMQPVNHLEQFFVGNVGVGWFAWQDGDDSIYVCGYGKTGILGNGLFINAITRPWRIPVMAGKFIKDITGGYMAVKLYTDGTVSTCGTGDTANNHDNNYQNLGYTPTTAATDFATDHLINVSNVTQIAGAQEWHWAVDNTNKVKAWGRYGGYMTAATNAVQYTTPTDVTAALYTTLPAGVAIKKIGCNSMGTYFLMMDSTLWFCGDKAQGVGDGVQLDFANITPIWAWPFTAYLLPQRYPVPITRDHRFINLFFAQPFIYYVYALDSAGVFWAAGRNKSSVIANKIVPCNGTIENPYPDWNNVVYLTPVDVWGDTINYTATCQACYISPYKDTLPCLNCAFRTPSIPTANAGADTSIVTGRYAVLNSLLSTDPIYIGFVEWTIVSGPGTAYIGAPGAPVTQMWFSESGTYVVQLKVTNVDWTVRTDTKTIVVQNAAAPCKCVNLSINEQYQQL